MSYPNDTWNKEEILIACKDGKVSAILDLGRTGQYPVFEMSQPVSIKICV
jgi:hypothetical protein